LEIASIYELVGAMLPTPLPNLRPLLDGEQSLSPFTASRSISTALRGPFVLSEIPDGSYDPIHDALPMLAKKSVGKKLGQDIDMDLMPRRDDKGKAKLVQHDEDIEVAHGRDVCQWLATAEQTSSDVRVSCN
jgi:hypothetical protein